MVRYRHDEEGALRLRPRRSDFPSKKPSRPWWWTWAGKHYRLALLPGDRQMSLKRVATVFSAKRAAMADLETAERLTGYRVGGISPFGVKEIAFRQ